MKIGVIGDTHGFFHPGIPEAFAGVEKIIHTGDLGSRGVYEQLKKIAPVLWVKGNHEPEEIPDALPDFSVLDLAGKKIMLTHTLTTMSWEYFKDALLRSDSFNLPPFSLFQPGRIIAADSSALNVRAPSGAIPLKLVIFGHTHYPIQDRVQGVYFLNPGYCGNDQRENEPTAAILELTEESVSSRLIRM